MNTFPLLLNLRILNQPIAGKTGQHGFLELFFPDFIPAFIYREKRMIISPTDIVCKSEAG